nr:hypothetical protein [Tanacetum cinerariifolium]
MVSSKEHKKAALHEKLQLLRSITNSHAENDPSIILDASKYIEELKHKVKILNQDITSGQSSSYQNPWPEVTVEAVEKGSFHLEAFGVESEENGESLDADMVKQSILHAIENWSQNNDR